MDNLRNFVVSFYENIFNKRKFFTSDLDIQMEVSSVETPSTDSSTTPDPVTSNDPPSLFSDQYNFKSWNRLFDEEELIEKMLLIENTLKYCLEYKTSDGKCNLCKDGYIIMNNYCLRNDNLSILNCLKYGGSLLYLLTIFSFQWLAIFNLKMKETAENALPLTFMTAN